MRKPEPQFTLDGNRAREIELLESLEAMLCGSDACLLPIVNTLESCCDNLVDISQKNINKIIKKLLTWIDKKLVIQSNNLDLIITKIFSSLYYSLESNELTLTQICIKAGLIQVGGNINVLINLNKDDVGPKEKCPEFHINISALVEVFNSIHKMLGQVVYALRDIRNRMPPSPIEMPFERNDYYQEPKYTVDLTPGKSIQEPDIWDSSWELET